MRVLVGPCAGLRERGPVLGPARALAGPGGSVVSLAEIGVRNLSRPISTAEVALLRIALRKAPARPGGNGGIVGYVCGGVALASTTAGTQPNPLRMVAGDQAAAVCEVVVAEDHVNLTWRSPLTGPNDDSAGPRFPSMTGVYLPGMVLDRLSAAKGMIVRSGVVAGVLDESHLNAFEAEMVEKQGYAAVSRELVPVVIVAAHLGLRVAAAVVLVSCTTEGVG
jgi:hypothetical protein